MEQFTEDAESVGEMSGASWANADALGELIMYNWS